MKNRTVFNRFRGWLALVVFLAALPPLQAVSTVRVTIKKAQNIEVSGSIQSSGLVIEEEHISFVASGQAQIFLLAAKDDPENRSMINGRKATSMDVLAENCRFTIYKPRYWRDGREKTMDDFWKKTLEAVEKLKAGKPVTLMLHQPDMEIRQSVIRTMSGVGDIR